ncbi:MAG: murein biosynthesis integral membrane protein MurJ [bacterium]|nr:murein biosynthesis integral membrane protein MurJ [bacterium]
MSPKSTGPKSLLRSILGVSSITLLSRVLGLLREMVRAALLGTSLYSDAFSLAFSLPNLFRRLTAEGAMSNAFIPVFCEADKKDSRARALDFARSFFWILALILTLLTLLFIWQADFLVAQVFASGFSGEALEATVFLTQVMFGYMILISLAAVAQGVLNSLGTFWVSALTPVLLNLAILGAALGMQGWFENPALPFAIGVMLGGCLQLAFQLPYLHRAGFRLFKAGLYDPKIKEVFRLILPTLFGVGIYQINILISNLIATTLGEGALSSLTFSNRLLELVLGVFVVSITTVILPRLSGHFIDEEPGKVVYSVRRTLSVISFVTFPVTALTLALAAPMVELLFLRGQFDQRSLDMTAGALVFHIAGLSFIAYNRVFLAVYQSARRIQITVWISLAVMLANLGGALWLSRSMGHLGIALASSASQGLNLLLLWVFSKRLKVTGLLDRAFGLSLARSLGASVLIYWTLVQLLPLVASWPLVLGFLALSLVAVGQYLVLMVLLKSSELKETWGLLRARGKRP